MKSSLRLLWVLSTTCQVLVLLQVEVASDSGDEEFFDAEERELASVSSRRSLSSQLSSRSTYYEASSEPPSPSVIICISSAPRFVFVHELGTHHASLSLGFMANATHMFERCLSNAARGRGAQLADAAAREPAAWELDFNIWRPASPLYRGTDAELTMKLTTFWFFCNRPTVGSLISLGTDLAAATAVAKPKADEAPIPAEQTASPRKAAPQQVVSIPGSVCQPGACRLPVCRHCMSSATLGPNILG
jgi:hypothetical protein